MKYLNLYDDDCVLRSATKFQSGMTDRRFLELEISSWLASPLHKQQIDGNLYYHYKQEILKRRRTAIGPDGDLIDVSNLPNNRLISNLYAKMVDQKTNYSFGKPFSFDTETEECAKALDKVFGTEFRRTMRVLGEGALIGGVSWLYPYIDQGELKFRRFPAHEVLPFWADEDHTELDAAIHIYVVQEYDEKEEIKDVVKVEVFHGGGVDFFVLEDDGSLRPDEMRESGAYMTRENPETGEREGYNWERIPLICFKSSHHEIPLLTKVKCLQDAYNELLSDFANGQQEDVNHTILVLKNYDGEDLGTFRSNLATYGAVKVRSFDGAEGGVDTLEIEVNAENYKTILDLLKNAIIENAKGYDAKDSRLSNNPNQMNIQSMYSDIDLDANDIETEFQASMSQLMYFVNLYWANTGQRTFEAEDIKIIFDRDILVNESEAIANCKASVGILSDETIVKMHPWVSDPEQEMERIKKEKEENMEMYNPFGTGERSDQNDSQEPAGTDQESGTRDDQER